jgi:SAM-dependent methyltransferase
VTPQIQDFLFRSREFLPPNGYRALEVGSRDVNGTPRQSFNDASWYCGVDIEPGPCVDLICGGESLSRVFAPESFEVVICCETLEHCVRPWVIAEQIRHVLKPGGLLIASAPTFGFPEHRYPIDCYRFGEDAFRLWLFAGMTILNLETLTDDAGQPCIAAVGRR